MRQILPALMFMTLALAGCSEDAAPVESADDAAFEEFEVEVTEDTGVIRGVVFDQAIVPISGATITLASLGLKATSNQDGAFLFGDLDAGTYFLETKALGYKATQSSVEVVAGVASPKPVKIQLAEDPSGIPYATPYIFKGYIMCGTNVVALCGGVRDFTGLTDDTYSAIYDTGSNISHLQTEMVWKNTQQFGDSFSVSHRYATYENYNSGFYDGSLTSGSGPSPLKIVTNVERYNENNVGEDYEFMTSIFAGGSEAVELVGVALDQNYEMFIHEFHGYAPPEDWRFTDDGTIPPP